MDSKCNFIDVFKEFIISCDEIYLIDAANKGLYKRASKEIDKGITAEVSFEEDKAVCKISDGTICDLTDNLEEYKCSCPSKNICKHILICILYIQKNMGSIFGEEVSKENNDETVDEENNNSNDEEDIINEDNDIKQDKQEQHTELVNNKKGDFSWILDYPIENIKKEITEKQFKDILFRLNFGIDVQVNEENFLIVQYKDTGIRVRFTEKSLIEKTICTCKQKEFCTHKAEAVLYYKLYKKALDLNELYEALDLKICKEAVKEVKCLIKEITILGLARLPESILDRIETTAVVCHSSDLPRLEKLLRSLKSKLQLYFNKHASFSKEAVIRLITRIYNTVTAVEKADSNNLRQSLIGEHKTTYTEIPPIELIGMGAGAWKADSGYEGITYYFFNEKRKIWMTYTSMKPNYYEGRSSRFNNINEGKCPWQIQASMKDISSLKFILYNCKINKNYRISSSEETKGDIISKTDIKNINYGDKLYDDWTKLIESIKENFKYNLIQENENTNIALLKITTYGKSSFDEIKQIFKLPVCDINENYINITLKFNADTKYLIKGLERAEKRNNFGNILLGKIYKVEEGYAVDPITMYYEDGEMVNLTL
jgi:hypothetical protein